MLLYFMTLIAGHNHFKNSYIIHCDSTIGVLEAYIVLLSVILTDIL